MHATQTTAHTPSAKPITPPSSTPPQTDAERRATLVLSSIEGIGNATLRALKKAFGSLSQALEAPRTEVVSCLMSEGARAALCALSAADDIADRLLERLHAIRARIVFPDDAEWPRQLADCDDAPPLLYVRGTLNPSGPRLAIVGARAVDDYGLQITRFWAEAAARQGIDIVSGGARGVDSQAHSSALDAGGHTIVVFGTGIDCCYPPENAELFDRVLDAGGAIVSFFPPGTGPLTRNFILRNHLIAALSDATLVTRAGPISGALTTAKAAHQLNRPVFTLPGDLTASLSWGGQRLVESNMATFISGLEPIGRLLRIPGPWPSLAPDALPTSRRDCPPAPGRPKVQRLPQRDSRQLPLKTPVTPTPPPSLDGQNLSVFNRLSSQPQQFDELLSQCALDAAGLADALLRLELLGLCEELPGRLYRRTPSGR